MYSEVISEWAFSYSESIGYTIPYYSTTNLTADPVSGKFVTDYDMDDEAAFANPVFAFPIAIIGNFDSNLYPETIYVTENLLVRMITESTMRWNDPEIVQYNPQLSINTLTIRMVFDSTPSPINGLIIDYLFPENGTEYNSTFYGLAASKHVFANSFLQVVTSISGGANRMAFAPLPYVRSLNSPNVRIIELIKFVGEPPVNNTLTNETQYYSIAPNSSFSIQLESNQSRIGASIVPNNNTWPWVFFGYYYYTDGGVNCENNTLISRFLYWAYHNSRLNDKTVEKGFWRITEEYQIQELLDHLSSFTCNGDKMLVYTDISSKNRGNGVFILSMVMCFTFIIMITVSWYLYPRKSIEMAINHLIVIFGVICFIASVAIWWYTPRETSFCIARMWTLGMGYINIIATPFGYVVAYKMIVTIANSDKPLQGFKFGKIGLIYIMLNLVEIVLLILWQTIESPKSAVIVTDSTNWYYQIMLHLIELGKQLTNAKRNMESCLLFNLFTSALFALWKAL